MNDAYYILEDGEEKGPYTFDELTGIMLDVHTSVLSPLADGWQDACDLPELFPYFEAQGVYFPTGDNLASAGWRFLAYLIDFIILSFLMQYIFIFLASRGISFHTQSYNDLLKLSATEIIELQLISSITIIIYNAIGEASPMRGSIGKKLCRMVVVDADGIRLSPLNAIGRSVGKALSIFLVYTGFFSILFSEHKQALHDYIAKTYVVKRD